MRCRDRSFQNSLPSLLTVFKAVWNVNFCIVPFSLEVVLGSSDNKWKKSRMSSVCLYMWWIAHPWLRHYCQRKLDRTAQSLTAPLWTALHGAYSRGMLSDASVYTRSPLGDDRVYPCGRFSFAKYIPGISAPQSRALSLQAFSSARQGWGWWLEVSGWLSFTDGLDRLLTRATHIYHKEFLTKTTGTEGKPMTTTIYNFCPHFWDLTAQMCICHSSIWWSSERWQDSYILFIVPNYEQGHWRRE